MYLVGAIDKFAAMSRQDVKKIGFEVGTLGMKGFDANDSTQKYQIRSVPGRFSGLHMVCLMYAAFKITDPTADIGFDHEVEYATANQMSETGEIPERVSAKPTHRKIHDVSRNPATTDRSLSRWERAGVRVSRNTTAIRRHA